MSPRIPVLNPNATVMVLGGEAFRHESGHKDGVPRNGICALTQESPDSCLALSPPFEKEFGNL